MTATTRSVCGDGRGIGPVSRSTHPSRLAGVTTIRSRREPPHFRHVVVTEVVERSARLVRLTVAGPELAGFDIGLPAASVRLLVPDPGTTGPVAIPAWNGNEFLRADGSRPPIRTLTPVRFDPAANALDVEVVLHGAGPLSTWAATSPLGDPCAVAGTGPWLHHRPGRDRHRARRRRVGDPRHHRPPAGTAADRSGDGR